MDGGRGGGVAHGCSMPGVAAVRYALCVLEWNGGGAGCTSEIMSGMASLAPNTGDV